MEGRGVTGSMVPCGKKERGPGYECGWLGFGAGSCTDAAEVGRSGGARHGITRSEGVVW
jgi:hypothetical protein